MFYLSAIFIVLLISVLAHLKKEVSYNQNMTLMITLIRSSLIVHTAILIGLSIIHYFHAKTNTKHETALLIYQHDLQMIVDERTCTLELRTQELESIYDALPDSFLQLNKDGRIDKIFSGNSLYEGDSEKILGRDIKSFLSDDTGKQIMAALDKTLKTHELTTVECDMLWNGRFCSIECRFIASPESTATCIIRDITKRREFEESLKTSLSEREILIGEIHHRVKNNLMIIISLVNFYEETVDDTNKIQLEDLRNRIYSLSLIHEQMFNSDLVSKLKINIYLEDLTSSLLSSFPDQNVRFRMAIPEIYFSPERAVPLGLITTELVSTAVRSWSKEKIEKLIDIRFKKSDGEYEMSIICRNLRIPEEHKKEIRGSLGARLVSILVEQLNGTIIFNHTEDTEAVVKFPA